MPCTVGGVRRREISPIAPTFCGSMAMELAACESGLLFLHGTEQPATAEQEQEQHQQQGQQGQREEVKLPRKHVYRARAHSNPLNDATFPVPLAPETMEWDKVYPELWAAAAAAGAPPPRVAFADVGCGFGGLTVRLAEAYPDKVVLGMELRDKVSEYVRERIRALRQQHPGRYANAGVVRTNAMKFLPHYFHKGQLEKLFFLFPDPHFKVANHRRRIIQATLLDEYAYLLGEGALLYTITDVEDLASWMKEKLDAHPLFERMSDEELESDVAAGLLYEGTEEGQKVARNKGNTWRNVYRRVRGPCARGAAAAQADGAAEASGAEAATADGAAAAEGASASGFATFGVRTSATDMALAALSALQPRHCFGMAGQLRDGLVFLDEGLVAYPCGQAIVVYQTDTRVQRFVYGSADGGGITAFAACPARRVLALAERGGERPSIAIVDLQTLKRRKVLTNGEASCKEFVSVSFSSDGKYLVAQGGAPDWTLALWVWEKSKLVASVRTVTHPGHTVHQCFIQPGERCHCDEAQLISVAGEGTCRVYRIEAGNSLKPLPSVLAKRESASFAAHAWLVDHDSSDALVVGTAAGELLVVADGDVRQALALEGGAGVASLAAFGKGFVVGTTRGGLAVYERDADNKPYRLGRMFEVEPVAVPALGPAAAGAVGRVHSLAVAPGDDGVGALTEDNQLLLLAPNSGDKKGLFSSMHPLGPGFHRGEVTGLATCVRRPIVASCGADKTIRLWNHQDRTAELVRRCRGARGGMRVKAFDEEIFSLALHPSGYSLLVGFADRLRLMTVLADDLRTVRELPIKASRECAFSHGGAYFAAANGNSVHVHSAHTGAPLSVLRGHNGRVRSLWWSADDAVLVTAGVDGAIYEWRVLDGRRDHDFVQKGWAFTSAVGVHVPARDGGGGAAAAAASPAAAAAAAGGWPSAVYAAAADRRLRLLEDSPSGGLAVSKEVDAGTVLTQLVAPGAGGRLLFAATEDGAVRTYKLPLGESEFTSARCGGGAVTRLAASADEALLFAATSEGCVFVFDVKDRDPARLAARRDGEGGGYAEEVLVGRGDINEKRQRMAELEAQVAEVAAQNEYQLKLKDLALNERVRELTETAAAEAAAAKQRYDALLGDRNALEAAYEEKLRSAEAGDCRGLGSCCCWLGRGGGEKHAAQLDALDVQYQQKLIAEMERFQDLQARAREGWGAVGAMTQKALAAEHEATLRLQGENGMLKRRWEEQAKAVESSRAALKAAEGDKRALQGVIEGLRADVAALRRDVAGRDEAIVEKERRILDLKLKAQELEKFRFVLDYKIGELRAQLGPKDAELADVKALVQARRGAGLGGLEQQLVDSNKAAADAARALADAQQRCGRLQREAAKERGAAGEAARALRALQCDIYEVAQLIQRPEQLKAAVVALYQAHAAEGAAPGAAPAVAREADGGESAARQLEVLQQSVRRLEAQLEQRAKAAAAAQRRLVGENASLVATINELRREVKALQDGRPGGAPGSPLLGRGASEGGGIKAARGVGAPRSAGCGCGGGECCGDGGASPPSPSSSSCVGERGGE
eukprot:scaffold12.g7960.t1